MRILLHSYVFRPSVGGIEVVTFNLAKGLSAQGHEVTVLTDTLESAADDDQQNFRIVRTRNFLVRAREVAQHDVVHATGAFPACSIPALLLNKSFSWTHASYRLLNIDGLGWWYGQPTPMSPLASFHFHRQSMGLLRASCQLFAIYVRRLIAHLVGANVAITKHMMNRQPAPRQQVIYNPVDCASFRCPDLGEAMNRLDHADCTFAFLGRLVSEKGLEDLIRAFALVVGAEGFSDATLKIIGEGSERERVIPIAAELGILHRIRFVGGLQGEALSAEVARSGVFVLPSAWEEPMGLVVVELMAAGKPLIVSAVGGLSECAGSACVTFPNRDWRALADAMITVGRSKQIQRELVAHGLERCSLFSVETIAPQYLELFQSLRR